MATLASNETTLKRICTQSRHFVDCYTTLHAAKTGGFESWFEQHFESDIMNQLQSIAKEGGEFRALGVGTGPGDVDTLMMQGLSKRFHDVKSLAVEPAEGLVKLHQRHVDKMKQELTGVNYTWFVQGLDEFRKTYATKIDTKKFHFISAVQSAYFFAGDANKLQESIKWLYDQLEDGGVMLIIVDDETNGWHCIYDRFSFLNTRWPNYDYDDIRAAFTKIGVECSVFRQEDNIDITSVVSDVDNQDGRRKVDFLTMVEDFHGTVSHNLQQEMMEFLRSHSKQKAGKCLLNYTWDAITVKKVSTVASTKK